MIGVAFGIGFVFGPALGGVLGSVDPRLPFWVAAGLSLANAAYGYFVLPESLPPEKRRAVRMAALQPARLAQVAAFASRAHRARRRHVPQQPGACGAARDVRPVRGLSLWLGRARPSG